MAVSLASLIVLIGGYLYLTDSSRVRSMAQDYLSSLLGGRVEIGGASLSIFEGFRIRDVKVYVDRDSPRPDSLLFSAQAFLVNYDPRKLIRGELEATEIVAQKPHVYLTLTEGRDGQQWNYQRLVKSPPPPVHPQAPSPPPNLPLPEVLLRNAVAEISEVKAGSRVKIGSMDIDGQLTPVGDGQSYNFEMQSRGYSAGLGPYAGGMVSVNTGRLKAHLRNVEFGEDIRSMFPADVRDWWERHELSGKIESVDVDYVPAAGNTPARFSVETVVKGITLAVHREEWSSQQEAARWLRWRDALTMTGGAYRIAGFRADDSGRNAHPLDVLSTLVDTAPIRLREVTGTFLFNQDGVSVKDLLVRIATGDAKHPAATNAFEIQADMHGYAPDAPFHLQVSSADPAGIYFPDHPRFMDSLPADVRNIYNDIKPQGHCHIDAKVDRLAAGAVPVIDAKVDIVAATFLFHEFAYPFRCNHGTIRFSRDPKDGNSYVNVIDMRGSGLEGSANANAELGVSGRVGPIGPAEPGFDMRATANNVVAEPALLAAMPPDVREALRNFDANHTGQYPKFRGNFVTYVRRQPGPRQRMTFDTDVDMLDGAGRMVGFTYPIDHAHGKFNVRDGYVDVLDAAMEQGNATAHVSGRVRWADPSGHIQPLDVDMKIAARNMPVDQELIRAIPPDQSVWLKRLGVAGNLDCDGRIYTTVPADWRATIKPGQKPKDPPIRFDLGIAIHDGTIWPVDGLFTVSSVDGKLHLTPEKVDLLDIHGRRDNGDLSVNGVFNFAGASPQMKLHVSAKNLALDRPLYAMLPLDGRKAWDEVRPQGTGDAEIDFHGPLGEQGNGTVASAARVVEIPAAAAGDFRAVLKPRDLSVKVRTVPYPLHFTDGVVTIEAGHATLDGLVGNHGKAKFTVSGEGTLTAEPVWNLALTARDVPIDDELHAAMPPLIRDIFDGLKLHGTLGIDVPKLTYRVSASADADPDIDVTGAATIKDGSLDPGMLLSEVNGGMNFAVTSRQGKLNGLSGTISLDSLKLGGRPVSDLKVDLVRAPGSNDLHVDHLRANVAGGELGGSAVLTFPDQGSNLYTMNLVVKNADVATLTGEKDKDIRGELTASLALEGKWDDASARRGRGDVVVAGKQLYRIPLMLGLMQVTNLSLPIGQPFTRGTARYTVEGSRINFEQMSLSADTMSMNGSGYLDFATKQVRMTLTTDNPAGFKIPFITDLWQGARQELLKIKVIGTVQDPKVQPSSMGVITTTIDQVFKGDSATK